MTDLLNKDLSEFIDEGDSFHGAIPPKMGLEQAMKILEHTFIPLCHLYDTYSDECFHLGIGDSPRTFFESDKTKGLVKRIISGNVSA